MKVITPPSQDFKYSIFLAGSIEMGSAEPWQDKIIEAFKDRDVTFYNPRRIDWDSSWVQSIDNPQFHEQVTWELDHIENCSLVVFYFDPNTKSPISLMELGLMCTSHRPVIVCCPEGFWRKGNVDIVCQRYGIVTVPTLDALIEHLK